MRNVWCVSTVQFAGLISSMLRISPGDYPLDIRLLYSPSVFRISGWRYVLGINPSPIALLTALAIFLWLRGLSPVSFECFILPISVTYSDMMLKFYHSKVSHLHSLPIPTIAVKHTL